MHQSPDILASFGDWETRMERALASVRAGRGVLVVDDEDRENEGDLIYPAHSLTDAQMARLIRHCSGIVCLCLTDERATRGGLPPCGVLCELTNDDGTMARLPQVADFARANDLPLLAVADIVRWRERQEGRA